MLHRYRLRIDPKDKRNGSTGGTTIQLLHNELSGLISWWADAGFRCEHLHSSDGVATSVEQAGKLSQAPMPRMALKSQSRLCHKFVRSSIPARTPPLRKALTIASSLTVKGASQVLPWAMVAYVVAAKDPTTEEFRSVSFSTNLETA